eukprot:jgi/Galph1/3514/GphlegSOOS_G2171.1
MENTTTNHAADSDPKALKEQDSNEAANQKPEESTDISEQETWTPTDTASGSRQTPSVEPSSIRRPKFSGTTLPQPPPPPFYSAYGFSTNQQGVPKMGPDGAPLGTHSLPSPYQNFGHMSSPPNTVLPTGGMFGEGASLGTYPNTSTSSIKPAAPMYPSYLNEGMTNIPIYMGTHLPVLDPSSRPFTEMAPGKLTEYSLPSQKMEMKRTGYTDNTQEKEMKNAGAVVGSGSISMNMDQSERQIPVTSYPTAFSLPPPYAGFPSYDPHIASQGISSSYPSTSSKISALSANEKGRPAVNRNVTKQEVQEQGQQISSSRSPPSKVGENPSSAALSQPSSWPSAEKNTTDSSQPATSSQQSTRKLKVEDALAYLEQVKTQFSDQPHVYNKFLDIMKEFKAQTIDTPGVISRVSELFHGHPNLILGFNAFLPPGYKIELPEGQSKTTEHQSYYVSTGGHKNLAGYIPSMEQYASAVSYGQLEGYYRSPTTNYPQTMFPEQPSQETQREQSLPDGGRMIPQVPSSYTTKPFTSSASNVQSTKPVEFDQAISYVNKIKKRFASKPQVYRQFLDILHSYQKEQRSIKEVYEQVATLFQHDSDLLEEFTNFLPDSANQSKPMIGGKSMDKSELSYTGRGFVKQHQPVTSDDDQLNRKSSSQEWKTSKHTKREDKKKEGKKRQNSHVEQGISNIGQVSRTSLLTKNSMILFDQIRKELGPDQKYIYSEFIKCLSLFSQGIISRGELLMLCQELFDGKNALYEAFQSFLNSGSAGPSAVEEAMNILQSAQLRNEYDNKAKSSYRLNEVGSRELDSSKSWASKPLSEIALESQETCTVSYRKLPDNFPRPTCSGRGPLENAVLNDSWVSLPTGSEDFSFKHMRKNQYEDNLFRCEDDRYELDMVIETNAATIAKLEPIVAAVQQMTLEQKSRYALAEGILSPVHLRAIERIYGEHGASVVEQVKQSPSVTVGIVLSRLKQKDVEWRRTRVEMNKMWRETVEKNYYKSLDHRSFYFKQTDRKALNSKSLIAQVNTNQSLPAFQVVNSSRDEVAPSCILTCRGLEAPFENSEIQARYGSLCCRDMKHVLDIIWFSLTVECGEGKEADILYYLFTLLMLHFFRLKDSIPIEKPSSNVEPSDFYPFVGNNLDWETSQVRLVDESEGPFSDTHILIEKEEEKLQGNVLYGDESLYLLFRLFHLLYNRLAAAERMAQSQTEQARERGLSMRNGTGSSHDNSNHHLANSNNNNWNLQSNAFDSGAPVATAATQPNDLFSEYMSCLKGLLDGSLETSKYEDYCRSLLGTNSYILFTMDKLIARLVKQIQNVFQPNGSSAFWLLYYFHFLARKEQSNEWMYYQMVMSAWGMNNNTNCSYRIAHIPCCVARKRDGGILLTCSMEVLGGNKERKNWIGPLWNRREVSMVAGLRRCYRRRKYSQSKMALISSSPMFSYGHHRLYYQQQITAGNGKQR